MSIGSILVPDERTQF